jgi:hypothetical protein
LAQALLGPYSLGPNEQLKIEYPVTLGAQSTFAGFTSISNEVSATSTQQGSNPSTAGVVNKLAISDYKLVKSVQAASIVRNANGVFVPYNSNVTYVYTVTNGGTVPIVLDKTAPIDSLADPACIGSLSLDAGSDANNNGYIDPSETWTYRCSSHALTSDETGVATLTGTSVPDVDGNFDVLDSVTSELTVKVVRPNLVVTSTPLSTTIYTGGKVRYQYQVSTTGTTPISNPTVVANNCSNMLYASGDTDVDKQLDLNETWLFTCETGAINSSQTSQNVYATGADAVFYSTVTSNTVQVGVTVVAPASLSVISSAQGAVSGQGPGTTISVGQTNTVTYSYSVTGSGSAVSNVKVVDDHCPTVTYVSGDSNSNGKLDTTETWLFTCTVVGSLAQKTISNATASGTDGASNTVSSDSSSVTVNVLAPGLLLSIAPDAEYVKVGDVVNYVYKVQNYGETSIASLTPADDHCSPLVLVPGDNNGVLDPGETWRYACSALITADTTNTFTLANVLDANGTSYTATPVNARVFAIDPGLAISQTVTSFVGNSATVRQAANTTVDALVGDKLIFNYQVTATVGQHGSTVSGLNAMIIDQISDTGCGGTIVALESGGYNVGDQTNTGQLDPGETWSYQCVTTALTATVGTKTAQATLAAETVLSSASNSTVPLQAFSGVTSTLNTVIVTAAPTIATDPASLVLNTTATINGSAIWGGLITTASFCYGTDPALAGCTTVSASPTQITTGGTRPILYNLTGLTPGTTYYFRAAGVNSSGQTLGEIRSFTTQSSPPTAFTLAATNIARQTATLNGQVTWGGFSTTVTFCWGAASDLTGCTIQPASPGTLTEHTMCC